MRKRIYLSPPHMGYKEMEYINQAFETNWIAPLGPNVDAFERELCDYVGAKHGLALSTGTAAIHLALKYLGVGPSDTVFCSSLTFIGSCNPIVYLGATPVFVDCEEESWNMSPAALQKAFEWAEMENKMPKAVIIVDLCGQSARYDLLIPICEKYQVPIIEDAAEALGATYMGQHCGTFGDIGIFSFNGNKIITTSGGGMVVSKNKPAIDKIRFWATQAREPVAHYEHKEIGFNYRLSNICAGIGRGQLETLDEKIKRREQIFKRYQEGFLETSLKPMPRLEKGTSNNWLSVFYIDESKGYTPMDIIKRLEKLNIEARALWKPMHLQPVFEGSRYFMDEGDISAELFSKGICLPSGDALTDLEQDEIIDEITAFL